MRNADTTLNPDNSWAVVAAVLIGIAVPALIIGRAAILPFIALPVLLGLLAIRTAVRTDLNTRSAESRLLFYAISATALLWLISSVLSIDPLKSLSTWARTIAIIGVGYVLVGFLVNHEKALELSLRSLLITFGGVLILLNFALYIDPFAFELIRLFKGPEAILLQTLKPYFSVAVCVLPIVIWAGYRLGGAWKVAALWELPLTLSLIYGKGIQIGMSAVFGIVAAAILIASIMSFRRLSRRLVWAILIAVIVATVFTAVFVIQRLPDPPVTADQIPELSFPDWHRQVIWGFTTEVAKSAPYFGVGPNTVNLLPAANELIPGMNQEYIPSHPHNWPLEIAAETGIAGLISFAISLLIWLKLLANRALQERTAAWPMIGLFGAFWTSSLANFSIWSAWWLAVLAVLSSLPIAAMVLESKNAESAAS